MKIKMRTPCLLAVLGWGCATLTHGPTETPTAVLLLALTSPHCAASSCSCRARDDDEAEIGIASGGKRFEFRTGRGGEHYDLLLDGHAWRRNQETAAESCAYFDLLPGRHTVRVQMTGADPSSGMAVQFQLREYGARALTWYETFTFACGNESGCTSAELADFERGVIDRCGSANVEKIKWSGDRQGATLRTLTLDFVLHVYEFVPTQAHGCKGKAR